MIGQKAYYKRNETLISYLQNTENVSHEGSLVDIDKGRVSLIQTGKYLIKQEHLHALSAFNFEVGFTRIEAGYHFRIGLMGSQVGWSQSMFVIDVSDYSMGFEFEDLSNNRTRVSLNYRSETHGVMTKTSKIINKSLVGEDEVRFRVLYANHTMNLLVMKGTTLITTLRYKYSLANSEGHQVSNFGVQILAPSTTLGMTFFEVYIPLVENGIVFIGDSITYGATRQHGKRNFVEKFKDAVPVDARNHILTFASGGASSTDIVRMLPVIMDWLKPSNVVLLIGNNDNYDFPERYRENLQTIKTSITASIKALNLTPERYDANYAINKNICMEIFPDYINSWFTLARTDNPNLVNPIYVTDNVHLSDSGNQAIAGLILAEL